MRQARPVASRRARDGVRIRRPKDEASPLPREPHRQIILVGHDLVPACLGIGLGRAVTRRDSLRRWKRYSFSRPAEGRPSTTTTVWWWHRSRFVLVGGAEGLSSGRCNSQSASIASGSCRPRRSALPRGPKSADTRSGSRGSSPLRRSRAIGGRSISPPPPSRRSRKLHPPVCFSDSWQSLERYTQRHSRSIRMDRSLAG